MGLRLVALLGDVAMFVWEAAAHMCTPLGEAGISCLPNESTVLAALASALGDQRGLSAFPTGALTKESSGGCPMALTQRTPTTRAALISAAVRA